MGDYSFRPVTEADLPMLADWLQTPAVSPWWRGAEKQLAGIAEDLCDPAMTQVIALSGESPIAYAQFYEAHHWDAPHFRTLPQGTLAIDVFAGPEGLGHGGGWLRALSDKLLADAPALVIDPEPTNARAIRAYEKAGFAGDVIAASEDGTPARIMTRYR